jgi:hypothetical protein
MKRLGQWVTLVVVGAVLANPHLAKACATCYGASDAPQTKGMNMAIMALLVVIGGVLAAFASFFLHLRKQEKLHRCL